MRWPSSLRNRVAPILAALAIWGCAGRQPAPMPSVRQPGPVRGADASLDEANRSFTFNGSPFHPFLVRKAENLVSDDVPIKVNLDVAAVLRSPVCAAAVEADGQTLTARDPGRKSWYQYQWLGALDDGTHVLRTVDSPVGSAAFVSLMFVQFGTGKANRPDGTQPGKLFFTAIRWYPLGDRDDAKIELQHDRVIVHPSKYRKEAMALTPSPVAQK